ncbi:MAG: cache domain-containing protein, partial [Myxococcota bacterium]
MAHVNLHCHSTFSDGTLSPEQLAQRLATEGVRVASLTDHDTVEGLAPFKAACAREGIGFVPGLEMAARTSLGEVHLLAYGFDSEDRALKTLLASVARKDRSALAPGSPWSRTTTRAKAAQEVIRVIHEAGGRVFLAHPLDQTRDLDRLRSLVLGLKVDGLDGIEAIYASYSADEIATLTTLAQSAGLLVSAGTDYHGPGIPRLSALGVEMPSAVWEKFRTSLFSHSSAGLAAPLGEKAAVRHAAPQLKWTGFILRIVLPTLLAIGLLVVPVFTYLVPAFEEALLARKREMIQELTSSAWSMLAEYHAEERSGRLTRADAQQAAIARVRSLRYGKEGKDYFWITDMHPNMVMHPYRSDLNGQDVSAFTDPMGKRVFMEFLRVARQDNEGYLEYLWQWKDDPGRMAPKQSYVKHFQPWGWVIGTGIYLDDVRAEIAALTSRIIHITLALAVIVSLLFLFVARQSLHIERQRGAAEDALRESREKYRALVEASKEGTMMVQGTRLAYANQTLLALLGYSEDEWALLDLGDVIFDRSDTPGTLSRLVSGVEEGASPETAEAQLRRKDGAIQEVLLTTEQINWGEKRWLMITVKDLTANRGYLAALDQMSKRET